MEKPSDKTQTNLNLNPVVGRRINSGLSPIIPLTGGKTLSENSFYDEANKIHYQFEVDTVKSDGSGTLIIVGDFDAGTDGIQTQRNGLRKKQRSRLSFSKNTHHAFNRKWRDNLTNEGVVMRYCA